VEYTYYGSPYPYYGYAGWAPYGYGGGWWDGGVFEQLRGTLTVDIADARTGDLLWRGVEEGNVHQKSKPEKRDKRVVKEVAEIFEHFPVFPRAVATTGVSGAVSTTGRR
jgi:hypothetical protein